MIWRIDDIGASTKHFNQHSRQKFYFRGIPYFYFPLSNFWFFKRIRPFRKWAKYDELTPAEWSCILPIFAEHHIRPIIAITATWVDEHSRLIPFPEKFPAEAAYLKRALQHNQITVANHGLTHCIVGRHLPRWFSSNRESHREFWPHLDESVHREHIVESQRILEVYFDTKVDILVPPGNVWSIKTYRALEGTNIKQIMCNRYMADSQEQMRGIEFISDNHTIALHDRDLRIHGNRWLAKMIMEASQQ